VDDKKGIFETIIDVFRKANIKPSWNESDLLKQLVKRDRQGDGDTTTTDKDTE